MNTVECTVYTVQCSDTLANSIANSICIDVAAYIDIFSVYSDTPSLYA